MRVMLDELEGIELDDGGGSALQFGTIVASPASTNSLQAEYDFCEQVPEFNLQKTISDELLEGSPPCCPPPEGDSLEQAKNANTTAKIAANERKRLVFIENSLVSVKLLT